MCDTTLDIYFALICCVLEVGDRTTVVVAIHILLLLLPSAKYVVKGAFLPLTAKGSPESCTVAHD